MSRCSAAYRREQRCEHVRDSVPHPRGELVEDDLRSVVRRPAVVVDLLGHLQVGQLVVRRRAHGEIDMQQAIHHLAVLVQDDHRSEGPCNPILNYLGTAIHSITHSYINSMSVPRQRTHRGDVSSSRQQPEAARRRFFVCFIVDLRYGYHSLYSDRDNLTFLIS